MGFIQGLLFSAGKPQKALVCTATNHWIAFIEKHNPKRTGALRQAFGALDILKAGILYLMNFLIDMERPGIEHKGY